MGLFDSIGKIFDETGRARARQTGDALNNYLVPGSDYYNAEHLGNDEGVLQGAAQLSANKVGYDASNFDADTAAIGSLGNTFGDIAQNGGQLTQAVLNQARSDLANTNIHNLDRASRQQASQVLAQDSAERNWAASQKNQSRAQQLAAQLQKQVWNTAVSHANFQSALASQGLKNQDHNAAFDLANNVATAGRGAQNSQTTIDRVLANQDFNNTMAGLQAIGAGLGSATGTVTDMLGAGSKSATPATSGNDVSFTIPASTQSKYVNPITGNSVNLNMPTDSSAWGDWLTSGSTLASV